MDAGAVFAGAGGSREPSFEMGDQRTWILLCEHSLNFAL